MCAANDASGINWFPVHGTKKQLSENRGVGTPCEDGFSPGADGRCPRRQDDDQPHHEAQTWINTRAARNKLALTMLVIRDICGE